MFLHSLRVYSWGTHKMRESAEHGTASIGGVRGGGGLSEFYASGGGALSHAARRHAPDRSAGGGTEDAAVRPSGPHRADDSGGRGAARLCGADPANGA